MGFVLVISLPLILFAIILALGCYLLGRAKGRQEASYPQLSALKFKLTYRQKEKSCHYSQSTFSMYLNAKAGQQLMSWQDLLPQLLNGTGIICP
ncbi:hypothetical protein AAC387_Pa07g3281 [Persea americana]